MAELFQSRCLVYRRADDREIKPVRGADIAIADFAHMQRQTEMDLRFVRAAPFEIALCDLLVGGTSGSESGAASWRRIFISAELENCQHSVAHKLERLASFCSDDLDHRFEIIIEQADYFFTRQRIGQSGEAAQIAEPDNRANIFAAAASDRAREHALASSMADVGIHQMTRDAPRRLQLDNYS